jgi:predicted phage tail protein
MDGLTHIKFHGTLAEELGQESWDIDVSSVSEALRAVDVLTGRKLTKAIFENEKQKIKYKILVNDKNLISKPMDIPEDAIDSEFFIEKRASKIDVIPVIEGAGGKDGLMVAGGSMLVGMGWGNNWTMVMIGAMAILYGMSNILSSPPDFEDFREIQQTTKKESYLFNGAANTYNPGGPVPVGYGRMIIGSLAIAYSHENKDKMIYKDGVYYPD